MDAARRGRREAKPGSGDWPSQPGWFAFISSYSGNVYAYLYGGIIMSTVTSARTHDDAATVEPLQQQQLVVPKHLPAHPEQLLVADDDHLVASGVAVNLRELRSQVSGPAPTGHEAIDFGRHTR